MLHCGKTSVAPAQNPSYGAQLKIIRGSCIKIVHPQSRQQKTSTRIHRLSGSTKKTSTRRHAEPAPIVADALLSSLPHPLLIIGEGLRIDYANTAAEDFFQMSAGVLCKRHLGDVVAFGSPLMALVEQVQRNGTTVNEYGVDVGSYRFDAPKLVDLYAGPLADTPGPSC